jgi:hypothetical protein
MTHTISATEVLALLLNAIGLWLAILNSWQTFHMRRRMKQKRVNGDLRLMANGTLITEGTRIVGHVLGITTVIVLMLLPSAGGIITFAVQTTIIVSALTFLIQSVTAIYVMRRVVHPRVPDQAQTIGGGL